MHVKKDDIPLVAYPKDELWVVFRDQPANAIAWISAVTPGAVVQVASGSTDDPTLLTLRATVTQTFKGQITLVNFTGSGVALTDKYVRFKPTSGRVSVTLASPLEFRHFLKSLIV